MQIVNLFSKKNYRIIPIMLGLWLIFDLVSRLGAEFLWFDKVGYLSEFILRLVTQFGLWAIAFFTSICFLLGNLTIAKKFQHPKAGYINQQVSGKARSFFPSPTFIDKPVTPGYRYGFRLRWLLPTILGLTVLVATIVLFYSQQTLNVWYPDIKLPSEALPFPFWLRLILNVIGLRQFVVSILQLIVLTVVTAAIFISYEFWLKAIAVFVSLLLGFLISARWINVLEYFSALLALIIRNLYLIAILAFTFFRCRFGNYYNFGC